MKSVPMQLNSYLTGLLRRRSGSLKRNLKKADMWRYGTDMCILQGSGEMIKRKSNILTGNLEIGKKYRIKYMAGKRNRNGTTNFEGYLIEKMDKYLIFKSVLGFRECFLKTDFVIGEYSIEEVE